jgi:farnesyl diphosphate synthase
VQALKNCSVKQRKVLEQNYGVWDDKKVKKVKQLYEELQIERMFKAYEEESYKEIQKQLESVRELPKEVFELLLKKIYKRSK